MQKEMQTTLTEVKTKSEKAIKVAEEAKEKAIKRASIQIEKLSGNMCPDCGNVLEMIEGCEICRACGYSRC